MSDDKPKNPEFSDDELFDDSDFGDDLDIEDQPIYGGVDDATEDDFIGDEEFADDDFADEDWDHFDDDADPGIEASPQGGKKKMPMFNVIVIGGAVVLGLGVMVLQLGGDPAPAPTTQVAAVQDEYDDWVEMEPASDERARQEAGIMNDPSMLAEITRRNQPRPNTYGEARPVTEPPMPAPFTTGAMDEGVLTPMPSQPAPSPNGRADIPRMTDPAPYPETPRTPEFPQAASPAPAPATETPVNPFTAVTPRQDEPSEFQTAGDVPASVNPFAPEPQQTDAELAAPATITSPPQTTRSADPRTPSVEDDLMMAVHDKLDQFLNRLDQLDSRLSSIEGRAQPDTANLTDLHGSLKTIENRIAGLERAAADAPRTAAAAPRRQATPTPSAPPTATTARPARATTTVRAEDWILRSAQNGQAYVSRRGQPDMLNIGIGDTLSGIGRITAIEQQNGRWVVTGSLGRIEQ